MATEGRMKFLATNTAAKGAAVISQPTEMNGDQFSNVKENT